MSRTSKTKRVEKKFKLFKSASNLDAEGFQLVDDQDDTPHQSPELSKRERGIEEGSSGKEEITSVGSGTENPIEKEEEILQTAIDSRPQINVMLERALKQLEAAFDVLGDDSQGKTVDDIFLESMDYWRSFQLKLMDLNDPVLKDEAAAQFKAKLFSVWMDEIELKIQQYNPESAKALQHMQNIHRILFSGSGIASFEEERNLAENKANADTFQKNLEGISQQPVQNRFISPPSKPSPPNMAFSSGMRPYLTKAKKLLFTYIPILNWLPVYTLSNFRGDIIAGLTIAVMIIPQGMAYALLAGLPPIYGLYSAFIPPIIYAIFGSSNYMAVSCEAISSLLIGEAVRSLNPESDDRFIELSNLMAFMMGILLLIFGTLNFGFVLNFLSRPVLSGFTSAAAVVIAFNQLKHFFGIEMENSPLLPSLLESFFREVKYTNNYALGFGIGSLLFLLLLKKFKYIPKTKIPIPGTLIVVVFSTMIVYFARLDIKGVKVVGAIPKGLPIPSFPRINRVDFVELLQDTLLISMVAFMESISIAKLLAAKHKLPMRENQEFIALGLVNIVGSCFKCYPTAGALGRTAVNEDVGAKTQISGIISAMVIMFTLLFLTPLFHYLPNAILASVILVAVLGIVDYKEAMFLWVANKREFILMTLAFILTLVFGVEVGVLTSVAADLVLILYMASRPNTEILGRLPGTIIYRNIERFPEAITVPGVVVFRFDATLFFGNIAYLHEKMNAIRTLLKEGRATNKRASFILVCDAIPHIDTTAVLGLADILREYAEDQVTFCFAALQGPALVAVQQAGLVKAIGKGNLYFRIHEAVNAALANQLHVSPIDRDNKWMKDGTFSLRVSKLTLKAIDEEFSCSPECLKIPLSYIRRRRNVPPKQLEEDDTIPVHSEVPIERKSDREHDVGTITNKSSEDVSEGSSPEEVKVNITSLKEEETPMVELIDSNKMNDT